MVVSVEFMRALKKAGFQYSSGSKSGTRTAGGDGGGYEADSLRRWIGKRTEAWMGKSIDKRMYFWQRETITTTKGCCGKNRFSSARGRKTKQEGIRQNGGGWSRTDICRVKRSTIGEVVMGNRKGFATSGVREGGTRNHGFGPGAECSVTVAVRSTKHLVYKAPR
ncbi:hypothetical protein LZ31DRAFT_189827 [Colletotrichum somersetense]|nr:hypothetical protein LZ31DRAFT_189827 [Colletotrichum somersetense]